jgi:cytochrome c oxidase subunit 1
LQLWQRPYNLLLISAILFFITGLLSFNTSMDIHFHDTYIIFSSTYFLWILAIMLFLFWMLYMATKSFLYSKKLSWTHICFTILSSLFLFVLPIFIPNSYNGLAGMPRRYYDFSSRESFYMFGRFPKMSWYFFWFLWLDS